MQPAKASPLADLTGSGQQVTVGVGGNFVTEVYKQVSPAVVHITNRNVQRTFWGPMESESTGSGVIVDKDGYILTNFHVIQGSRELIVVLNDGREYPAKLLGSDPGTDLALIKVDAEAALPFAALGDSASVEVGEWVVAIGNPRGLDWTVTVGVISALNREIRSPSGQTITGLLQTDAAINPGNSGGPLLNARGEVIGINDAIVSGSGDNAGIGLAIPVNTARSVLADLAQHGRVKRPWLGLQAGLNVDANTARRNGFPVDYGVLIRSVYRDSPAAAAGLISFTADQRTRTFSYDIITQVDGQRVKNAVALLDLVRNRKPGDTVKLTIYRVSPSGYEVQDLTLQLTELPQNATFADVI
jgi:S1-C subfamily serine protease